ncbi:MAG: hypothetical protein QNJ38_16785 [Prochloraceae cyanobacterium]|nr:hypothetical protein [Prochloraceae cyanobacterium]
MSDPSQPSSENRELQPNKWWRILKYLAIGITCNGAIWLLAISYLKNTPSTYTSQLILNVTSGGPQVNVNLPNIGQAATSSSSAFGSSSDPRENYKLIGLTSKVLNQSAEALEMSKEKFGEPKIKIINNTTMMMVEIGAQDPEIAREKAKVFYQTLTSKVEELRLAEFKERDKVSQTTLEAAEIKLTKAQERLSNYKVNSQLNSSEQIKILIDNIEALRIEKANTIVARREISQKQQSLSHLIQVSAAEAAEALTLQTDRQFQEYLQEYTQASTKLNALQTNRGPNYPDVVATRKKQEVALNALLKRGQIILNKTLKKLDLERLVLDNINGSGIKRSELFQELIKLNAESSAIAAKAIALSRELSKLETRLLVLTPQESVLESLQKDVQIAEAVFASTLTKIDLSRNDPFNSFPLIQIIEEPTLPEDPTSPKPKLVLAGAFLGSLLISSGLTLIWWRESLTIVLKKVLREVLA